MDQGVGLRHRKKAETRQRIADTAAAMFAERGYNSVAMSEVARAADVSDQTVYNYFPAKQDLVLDRAEEIRNRYGQVVRERPSSVSPAGALAPLVTADVERYRRTDLRQARGEFLAQSVQSPVLRRFVLEERERQTQVIAAAIIATDPALPPFVAHAHAAGLVALIQLTHDRIGTDILKRTPQEVSADQLVETVQHAFELLGQIFPPSGERSPAPPRIDPTGASS